MATMNVLDATGTSTAIEKPNPNGRTAASASRPVVLANEDKAAVDLIASRLAGSLAVTGDFYPATQPVSGTVGVSGSVAVTGPLTDTQLRATAVTVSAASLPLPAGAATAAKQDEMIAAIAGISPGGGSGGDASAANQVTMIGHLADIETALGGTLAVSGPLTDTQLRAAPVTVSGDVGVTGSVAVTGDFYPATQPVSIAGTVAVSGPLTDAQLRQAPVPVSLASAPLPTGAATATKQDAVIAALTNLLTTAGFEARIPTLGTKAASGSVSTTPSSDQDPIFDHANAVKASVTTTSSTAITPPAGCKYLRVHATADMFLRTDGSAAADAAGSIKITAGQPETIPVVAATAVTAIVATGTGTLYATPMKVR